MGVSDGFRVAASQQLQRVLLDTGVKRYASCNLNTRRPSDLLKMTVATALAAKTGGALTAVTNLFGEPSRSTYPSGVDFAGACD